MCVEPSARASATCRGRSLKTKTWFPIHNQPSGANGSSARSGNSRAPIHQGWGLGHTWFVQTVTAATSPCVQWCRHVQTIIILCMHALPRAFTIFLSFLLLWFLSLRERRYDRAIPFASSHSMVYLFAQWPVVGLCTTYHKKEASLMRVEGCTNLCG